MTEMALWIASDCGKNEKCLVLGEKGVKETPKDEKSWGEAQKMSYNFLPHYQFSIQFSELYQSHHLNTQQKR